MRNLSVISLIFYMSLTQFSTAATSEYPWPQKSSDLSPDPVIRFGSLPNGMGYLIRQSAEPPERISLRLVFQVGSLAETDEQKGLAHFLEHMAFNGTRNFAAGEMIEYFQRLGMAFGADTNASTGFDRTMYKLELPNGDASLREESLRLLRDYADGILLGEEEIEKERGIILAEKRGGDNVGYRTLDAKIDFFLSGTRFPGRLPIGEEEIIATAPREQFVNFYETWYRPETTFLVVTGDLDPDVWENAIRETFADYGADRGEAKAAPDLGEVEYDGFAAKIHREPEAKELAFEISTAKMIADLPDTEQRRLREGQTQILNSILTRRLQRAARSENSPLLSGYAYSYSLYEFVELSGISASVRPENWAEGVEVAEQELRKALEHGFSTGEVLEAEANLLRSAREKVASQETRRTSEWADEYASLINSDRIPLSPESELALAEEAAALSTPDTLQQLLRSLWIDRGRRLFMTGPTPADLETDAVVSAYRNSETVPVEPPKSLTDLVFPYAAIDEAAPTKVENLEDPELTQIVYDNGVRVNWKKTPYEEDSILITISVGGGGFTLPTDQPGLSTLAEGAFIQGGLTQISFDDLQTVTAGRTVSSEFSVSEDSFQLNGSTRPEDLDLQLDILRAYLLDPGFRPEGLSLFQRMIEPRYREIGSTWQGSLQSEGWPFLYGDFGLYNFPSEEELKARNYEELRNWLLPQFKEGYLEVSIVGDLEEDSLRASLDRVFGTLPGKRPESPRHTAEPEGPQFPVGETKDLIVESDIPQGLALIAFPSAGLAPVQQSRRLALLGSVFDDRIRLEIREKTGQAYAYNAGNRASENYPFGLFCALSILSPDKVAPVAEQLVAIAESLVTNPITEDERTRALAPNLKRLQDMRRDNRYWLRVLDRSQARPEQLEWAQTLLEGYQSITVEELQETAKEYLVPGKEATVLIYSPLPVATE